MIEFTQDGKHYRGYTGGHYFRDGVEIDSKVFYEVMTSRHARW